MAGLPATAGVAADGDTGTISGTVTDNEGTPLEGVFVSTHSNEAGVPRLTALTGADGGYVLAGVVPAAVYHVSLDDESWRVLPQIMPPVQVGAGVTLRLDVTLQRAGIVRGTVLEPAGPPAFAPQIWSTPGDSRLAAYDPQTGAYALLVTPGSFRISLRAFGFVGELYNDVAAPADATVLTVAAGEVRSGIDFGLSRGATLTGVVRDTGGRPIQGAMVKTTGSESILWQATPTDVNGRFTMSGVIGETMVCVSADGFLSRAHPAGRCGTDANVIVLGNGESRDIAVTLTRAASVSGRVLGPTGEPVSANVSMRTDAGEYAGSRTAADGTFTVTGVAPGTYEVSVWSPGGTYADQAYDWVPMNSGRGVPVVVAEGAAVTGIDVQMWYADLSHVFTDVQSTHPFVREISWMKANGITTGNANGTYGPTAAVTREAMAAFLYRMAGRPSFTPPARSPFRDVATSHPFYREICWLASEGISTGWSDGTFRPGLAVERQAMAAFLYRFAGKPAVTLPAVSPFNDVATSHPFYREIAWLAAAGVAGGYADGGYHPLAPVDRQAMAAFLNRLDRKVLD